MTRAAGNSTALIGVSLAAYAARELKALGIMPRFAGPFFKEFAVDLGVDAETFVEDALEHGILAGVPLGRFYPDLKNCLLVAFTEKRTRAEIDILVSLIAGAGGWRARARGRISPRGVAGGRRDPRDRPSIPEDR